MSTRTKYVVAGAAGGVMALWLLSLLPTWLALLFIVGVVAGPAAAYLLLAPPQRRRLQRLTRKQIGR